MDGGPQASGCRLGPEATAPGPRWLSCGDMGTVTCTQTTPSGSCASLHSARAPHPRSLAEDTWTLRLCAWHSSKLCGPRCTGLEWMKEGARCEALR